SMNSAIKKLRAALSDSPENSRYVETIPKLGYRFIAPVEEVAKEARTRPERIGQATEGAARVSWSRRLAVLVPTLALTIGLVVWQMQSVSRRAIAGAPLRSIAVLPLANLSGDASQEYFSDGITDQLITDLAKVGSLRVISRTSVLRYKGTKKGLPEIVRELHVDTVVEGSVIRSGRRVRVTAQLLQAASDQHLWAETYDRDIGDVLRLQGEVADAIAQQIRAQLTSQQQAQLRRAAAVDPAAYDAYLKGRLYFSTEFTKPDSL